MRTPPGKKKIIDSTLRNLLISKQIVKPSSSFINEKGNLIQTKYNHMANIDDERAIIEASPIGQKIKDDYARHIGELMEEHEEYRQKKSKRSKVKRCRCKRG